MSFWMSNTLSGSRYVCAERDEEATKESIDRLRAALDECNAVLVGAGAGLSTAAGLEYSGKRFNENFADFRDAYGIHDMYSGGFYSFPDLETYWAWWSRHIWINRYAVGATKPYKELLELVQDKDYFVLTTNVDHQFQLAGFDKNRLFYTQGDYGSFQCSYPCTEETYDNEDAIRAMMDEQPTMHVSSDLVPKCPHCGAPMTTHLRIDGRFVEDKGWQDASYRYEKFRQEHKHDKILYLELGVGDNTPVIIKYPFWDATARNENAIYACVNLGESCAPAKIANQSILIDDDINIVLNNLFLPLNQREIDHIFEKE